MSGASLAQQHELVRKNAESTNEFVRGILQVVCGFRKNALVGYMGMRFFSTLYLVLASTRNPWNANVAT